MTAQEAHRQAMESLQRTKKELDAYRDEQYRRLHAFDEPFPDEIAFYAFRYALGRMADYIADHLNEVSERSRKLMIEEITKAEVDGGLGMDCDREKWLSLREKLEGLTND
jgi:hypothetical protein